MTYTEITENLCYYDRRNPDSGVNEFEGEELIKSHEMSLQIGKTKFCMCDNCFRGKTELALRILNDYALLKRSADYMQDTQEGDYNNSLAMEIYKHLGID